MIHLYGETSISHSSKKINRKMRPRAGSEPDCAKNSGKND